MIRAVPIRWRLVLAFAVAMALLLAGVATFLHLSVAHGFDESINQSLRARADELARAVSQAGPGGLSGRDEPRLAETDETFSQVLAPSGRVLDASSPLLAQPLLGADTLRRAEAAPVFLTIASVPGLKRRARALARATDTDVGRRIVVVGASLEDRDDTVSGLTRLLVIAGPIALALASALGYAIAAGALRPVEAMRRRAERISGVRTGERLPLPAAGDELGRLGRTLNGMLERIDGAIERERAFVADASHELRTPLAILKAEIELALGGHRSSEELRRALVSAGEETDRLARLAEDLLVLARTERGRMPVEPEALPAGELLDGAAGPFRARARDAGRRIAIEAADAVRVTADRRRIEQAIGNLIDNALRHGDGDITLRATSRDGGAELAVRDAGAGFDPAFADRAFERFSRADPARGGAGAGLGLAIVRAIAEAHGGTATLAPSQAGGAEVRIWLPRGADAPGPSAAPGPPTAVRGTMGE